MPVAPARQVAAPPRVVTYDGDTVWDALAQCESGGNWAINTGNGYYGGLQFSLAHVAGYGGGAYADYPHEATREEQIAVAERLRAARGYQPWPACRVEARPALIADPGGSRLRSATPWSSIGPCSSRCGSVTSC